MTVIVAEAGVVKAGVVVEEEVPEISAERRALVVDEV